MSIKVDIEKCLGCGCCIDICRFGALELQKKAVINVDLCTECGKCCDLCPAKALKL